MEAAAGSRPLPHSSPLSADRRRALMRMRVRRRRRPEPRPSPRRAPLRLAPAQSPTPYPGRVPRSHSPLRAPFRPVPGQGEWPLLGVGLPNPFPSTLQTLRREGFLGLGRRGGRSGAGGTGWYLSAGPRSAGLGPISLPPPLPPPPPRACAEPGRAQARGGLRGTCGGVTARAGPWRGRGEAVGRRQSLEGGSVAASSPFRDRLSCPSGSPWRRKGFGHTEAGRGGGLRGAWGWPGARSSWGGVEESRTCFTFLSGR